MVAVQNSKADRRGDSSRFELNKPTNDQGTGYPIRAWQWSESTAATPETVAVIDTTTLIRRPAEVTS